MSPRVKIEHVADPPFHRSDILDAIMDLCEEDKSYGTIALLGSLSKHHRGIVQPRLKRIKETVVLDLDDFAWRNKENDQNIE